MDNIPNSTILPIPKHATQFFIDGPQGRLDCLELKPQAPRINDAINDTNAAIADTTINNNSSNSRFSELSNSEFSGIAIIFHPNPVGGGSYTNKVVQSIAKTLNNRGYLCICPNLRGVGLSDGTHDHGIGEVDDARAIYNYLANHDNYKQYMQDSLI